MDWLELVGFDNIIVKLFYMPDEVLAAIGEDECVTPIIESELTPTAAFLKEIGPRLEDPFLVTNADTLTEMDLREFIELHLLYKNVATVFTNDDALHTGGTYVFDKSLLPMIHDDWDIPDLMKYLVDNEFGINLYYSDSKYFDIGTHDKLRKARNEHKN